jgi:hypothetical protein
VLDPEANVLADPGAADLALPDGVGDPAGGHVEVGRCFVDGQQRLMARCSLGHGSPPPAGLVGGLSGCRGSWR